MTHQDTQNFFDQLADAFRLRQGKQAFDLLRALLARLANWQLQEKLQTLEETYQTMLHYIANDITDPGREKIYTNLLRSLYQIADTALLQLNTAANNTLFYEQKRDAPRHFLQTAPELIDQWNNQTSQIALTETLDDDESHRTALALRLDRQNTARLLFYHLWLSNTWTRDEKNTWTHLLQTQAPDETLPSLLITAITLSLLEVFDENKALLLFHAAHHPNPDTCRRAITGILLFLRKYDYRLPLYPDLAEPLRQLGEDPNSLRHIRNILLQFILSRETEKITHKINTELIPELIKNINPGENPKSKLSDWMTDPTGFNEKNPEWETFIEQSGLQDQFREITELQMEGADVMHSTFIHLKNYPFFNDIAHWFLPFSAPGSSSNNPSLTHLVHILTHSTLLCNSDRYSFYFSIEQMPEAHRNAMIAQFAGESEAINEMQKETLPTSTQNIDPPTRHYIQDLYRFYKLHPRRNDFEDIFRTSPEFYTIPSIRNLIADSENLLLIGEYYFNKNYFREAADIFAHLLQTDPNNDTLQQKQAYSLQMTGQLHQALDAYRKAELLAPNHSWTIKKLAHLHRILKNPEEALFYYKKAEQLHPDNLALQLSIGHCHLDMKEYEQALKHYFKVEYLAPNKEKAWRSIAWTSFRHGKLRQAADYSRKLLHTTPTPDDYLNAGHIQLALHNTPEAIRLYRLSLHAAHQTPTTFTQTFQRDIPDLIEAGIDPHNLPFLLDCVFYE